MQRSFIKIWMLIMGVGAVLGAVGACSRQEQSLDPFPAGVPAKLSLQKNEIPPGYALITSTELLAQAGLSKNPDYLTRRADLEDIIQMDGAAAFLALYGPGDSVRLMVKGIFFRKPEYAVKYANVQSTRQRLVIAYRRDTTSGTWLLFIACDPDLTYDETEMGLIAQGLKLYQRRLTLTLLFDQMSADHTE